MNFHLGWSVLVTEKRKTTALIKNTVMTKVKFTEMHAKVVER